MKKDHWALLLGLTQSVKEIRPKDRKSLDRHLGDRLNLSSPTVRRLLSEWEKEGRILIERNNLTGGLLSLTIVPSQEIPSSSASQKVLVLVDFENLQKNAEAGQPDKFSIIAGFDRIIRGIAREVGEIVNVFVFVPPHLASLWGETFYEQEFFVISCPKIRDKTGGEIDTTDKTLIRFGENQIAQIPGLTHLCLGSGDKDFVPLVRRAIFQGLRIIVIASSLKSLSIELIELAERREDGSKMVHIFSPTENGK